MLQYDIKKFKKNIEINLKNNTIKKKRIEVLSKLEIKTLLQNKQTLFYQHNHKSINKK